MSHPTTENPPNHKCFINHAGKHGAMGPIAVLDMYKWVHKQHVVLNWIVCNDDSSIKAKLKWSNGDHMENNLTMTVPKIANSNCLLLTDTTSTSTCQTSLKSPHNTRRTGCSMSLQPGKGLRGNKQPLKASKLSP